MLQTFGVGKHSKNHIDSGMSNLSWNFLGWNQTRNCTLVQLFVQLSGIVKYQTKNGKNNLTISQVKRLTFALKVTQNQEFCPYSEIIRSERVLFRHITVLIKFWALINAESCVILFFESKLQLRLLTNWSNQWTNTWTSIQLTVSKAISRQIASELFLVHLIFTLLFHYSQSH